MGRFVVVRPLGIGATAFAKRFWRKYGVGITAIILIAVWTTAVNSIATYRATKKADAEAQEYWQAYYTEQIESYKAEQEAANSARIVTAQMEKEAEQIARVLYGVKGNSEDDLRTYAWCIFNRVDNRTYPNTVEGVISQPKQWMAYSPDNAVLDSLYQIALEEVETWHNGHRPVSSEYVFMNWTPAEITLRDNWKDGSSTHYWRYGK